MSHRNLPAALAGLALAFASVGCDLGDVSGLTPRPEPEPDPGPTTPTTGPEQQFAIDVEPLLQKCSGDSCHTGVGTFPLKFLEGASYYSAVTSFDSVHGLFDPVVANVLLKLEGGHQGLPEWTLGEKGKITDWLLAEREDRKLDPVDESGTPLPPSDSKAAMMEFAGCMTPANWEQAEMGSWANKGSNQGPCVGCHADGAYRFYANGDSTTMFNMNRTELYFISFFTVEVGLDGSQTVIRALPKFERMGGNGSTRHPNFDTSPNDSRMQRLQTFYDLTMAQKAAGSCGPAEFFNP